MFDETFWVTVAFLIFVVVIGRPIWRTLSAALDKRSAQIQKELDTAVKLREEAQALLVSYQRKQRDALKEAEKIVSQAKENADAMTAQAEKELEETLNKRIQLAMERINQAEVSALDDVKAHAVDIAVAASHKLMKEHLDKQVGDSLFASALKDIQKKLN